MKVEHQKFELMLNDKSISKKIFSKYAQIPYYTVAGWKKSGKVPAYAMVLLQNMSLPKTVNAQQLIDAGLPRAIFWNNNLTKSVPNDIFIVATLTRSYNDFVINKFLEFFGEESVLNALIKHKDKLSITLIKRVAKHINNSLTAA